MIVLNIGCGDDVRPDAINLDNHSYKKYESVKFFDINRIPWVIDGKKIRSGWVDKIIVHHILEHLSTEQLQLVTAEVKRVLKPKGEIDVKVPMTFQSLYHAQFLLPGFFKTMYEKKSKLSVLQHPSRVYDKNMGLRQFKLIRVEHRFNFSKTIYKLYRFFLFFIFSEEHVVMEKEEDYE